MEMVTKRVYTEEMICEDIKEALTEYDNASATIDIAESADRLADACHRALLMIGEIKPELKEDVDEFLKSREVN